MPLVRVLVYMLGVPLYLTAVIAAQIFDGCTPPHYPCALRKVDDIAWAVIRVVYGEKENP